MQLTKLFLDNCVCNTGDRYCDEARIEFRITFHVVQ